MWHKNALKYKLSLMPVVMSCLGSCAPVNCEPEALLPVFPKAGMAVADELESLSAADYPNLWEWISRLNKLRQELE